MAGQVSQSVVVSSSVNMSDLSGKYEGMIEVSTYKQTRNALFVLFDYAAQKAPPMFAMHSFITVWRLIQLYGSALVCRYDSLWGSGTVMHTVADVLSIFSHILPGFARGDIDMYVLWIYCGIFAVVYVFLMIAAFNFVKSAKLPNWAPTAITVFMGTAGYLLQPVAVCLMSELIGQMIMHPEKRDAMHVLTVMATLLVFGIYIWLYSSVYSVTVMLKPDSMQTVFSFVQMQVIIVTSGVNLAIGIAGELDKLPRMVLTGIAGCWCLAAVNVVRMKGGMLNRTHAKAYAACVWAEGFSFFAIVGYEALGMRAGEEVLFIVAALWVLFYTMFHCILDKRERSCVAVLDLIESDPDNFDLVVNLRHFHELAVVGMRNAHGVCLTWQFFKLGIEQWPMEVDMWFIFAKMTAIYVEETQQLNWIFMGIMQNGLSGSQTKATLQQISSIMKSRETNLIPELKRKIEKLNKQVASTKRKVRYIWDLIIQGNLGEVESAIAKAYVAIDDCEAEFLHLLRQFPNSRFVARTYARFLRDISADHGGFKSWSEKVTLLQRGVTVAPDQAHELGMMAFPNLPKVITTQAIAQEGAIGMMTEDTLTLEIEVEDEKAAVDAELRMTVRESINALTIPAFRMAKCVRIWLLLLLFVAPTIVVVVYFPIMGDEAITPLTIMYRLAELRTVLSQLCGLTLHYTLERANAMEEPDMNDAPPATFGGTHYSAEQVVYVSNRIVTALPYLALLSEFKREDPDMINARNAVFQETVEFVYAYDWRNEGKTGHEDAIVHDTISLNKAYMEYVRLARFMMELTNVNTDVTDFSDDFYAADQFNQSYLSTMFANLGTVAKLTSSTLYLVRAYVISHEEWTEKLCLYLHIGVMTFQPLLYIIVTIYIGKRVEKDKMTIYRCLSSLPKNVVSKVADSFKVLKKDDDGDDGMQMSSTMREEDVNRQEENILKIFATATDTGRGNAGDAQVLLISTIILVGAFLASTAIVIADVEETALNVYNNAPHVDFVTGSYAYDFGSVFMVIALGARQIGYELYSYDYDNIVASLREWQEMGVDEYAWSRFGDPENDVLPFYGYSQGMDEQPPLAGCDIVTVPNRFHDGYRCWTADLLTSWVQMVVGSFLASYELHNESSWNKVTHPDGPDSRWFVNLMDPLFQTMWHMHQVHLYNLYFYPKSTEIVDTISDLVASGLATATYVTIIMLIVAIFAEIALVSTLVESELRQKFAFRLLLHCPGSVIAANNNIAALLSGNFSDKVIDATMRNAEFYNVIVHDLPDAVITSDMNGIVITANKACQRIFNVDPVELIGTHLCELGKGFNCEENPLDIFSVKGGVDPMFTADKTAPYSTDSSDEIQIGLTVSVFQGNVIIMARDVTQAVMYNRLIADERAKSDRLLGSILPSRLVPRVQAGEKNISFAVQSASILFLDIVSFTPWCGSTEAPIVMKTLNMMFKEYDARVAVRSSVMRVKCIGDCYMAAGGIFMEVNQPSVHAKDVVEFGLDALECLEHVNVEMQNDPGLQIRVGINTGGPVVAGVLGTSKPTFEIIGPTINMAQQMEHHGVPGKVHVSRAVYELIYGGSFLVKERGEVQLKNGPAVTYVIDAREHSAE